MTKVKEVANTILDGIKPSFEKYGFVLNKSKREFKRSITDCVQIFDMVFDKESNYITARPEVRIKILSIEKIYRSATSMPNRPYLTLGNHLFDILRYVDDGEELGNREKAVSDWLIEGQKNVDKLIQVIPEYLEETILPYFDQNSSIKRVDELLNKYPRELSIHNRLYPLRANIAIIAAKLNKNPHYNELVQIYEEELAEAEETYKEEFYKLKDILRDYHE